MVILTIIAAVGFLVGGLEGAALAIVVAAVVWLLLLGAVS